MGFEPVEAVGGCVGWSGAGDGVEEGAGGSLACVVAALAHEFKLLGELSELVDVLSDDEFVGLPILVGDAGALVGPAHFGGGAARALVGCGVGEGAGEGADGALAGCGASGLEVAEVVGDLGERRPGGRADGDGEIRFGCFVAVGYGLPPALEAYSKWGCLSRGNWGMDRWRASALGVCLWGFVFGGLSLGVGSAGTPAPVSGTRGAVVVVSRSVFPALAPPSAAPLLVAPVLRRLLAYPPSFDGPGIGQREHADRYT